jgi:hypothetical protein
LEVVIIEIIFRYENDQFLQDVPAKTFEMGT